MSSACNAGASTRSACRARAGRQLENASPLVDAGFHECECETAHCRAGEAHTHSFALVCAPSPGSRHSVLEQMLHVHATLLHSLSLHCAPSVSPWARLSFSHSATGCYDAHACVGHGVINCVAVVYELSGSRCASR